MLFDLLLSPVASIINRGIDDNDDAQILCDALGGRSLRIVAKPLPNPILISAADGMVDVTGGLVRGVLVGNFHFGLFETGLRSGCLLIAWWRRRLIARPAAGG